MDATERARLSDQTTRILDRLKQGPATNVELAAISLKYTSRISDARKRGYVIECSRVPHVVGGGITSYRIVNGPTPPAPPLPAQQAVAALPLFKPLKPRS